MSKIIHIRKIDGVKKYRFYETTIDSYISDPMDIDEVYAELLWQHIDSCLRELIPADITINMWQSKKVETLNEDILGMINRGFESEIKTIEYNQQDSLNHGWKAEVTRSNEPGIRNLGPETSTPDPSFEKNQATMRDLKKRILKLLVEKYD